MTIHIAQRVIDGMKGGGRIDPYRGYIGQREPGQDRARRAQKLFEPHPSPAAEFPSSIKTYPSAQATVCGSALHPLFRDGCREAVVASGREGFEECVQRRQYWSHGRIAAIPPAAPSTPAAVAESFIICRSA